MGKENRRARRGRVLTPDEAALWEKVARTTEPLADRPKQDSTADEQVPPVMKGEPQRRSAPAPRPDLTAQGQEAAARPAPRPAAIQRKEVRHLTSGRSEIGARLDLHGMRQREAYTALKGFLQRAQANGHRYVLVITGKGRAGPDREPRSYYEEEEDRGVLKRMVPQWLAEPAFGTWVVGYQTAHTRHGGEGALYVRLRRAGKPAD